MRWISSKHGALGLGVGALTVAAATVGLTVAAGRTTGVAAAGQAPAATAIQSIGPLAFSPDGVLFAADRQAAAIYAFELGAQGTGGAPGATDVAGIDQQIASLVGTDAKEVQITDLAVHPKTKNAYISAMRGTGAEAKPVLVRVDGAGKLAVVSLDGLKMTKATLPNAPSQAGAGAAAQPADGIDHRHGFRRGQADRRRPLERGVRVEAADDRVSVRRGRERHQRRDLPRQPWRVRNALPGHFVRALQGRQHAAPHRRLHLHAAGEVPGVEPGARREGHGHDDRRARQPQSADRHDRLQQGRQGLPAHRQHQPWRHEGRDGRVRTAPGITPGSRPKPAASASSRWRRSRVSSSSTGSTSSAPSS